MMEERTIIRHEAETLYNVPELVEILGVNVKTVYRYLQSGQLKAIKMGKSYRVRESDLKDFVKRGTDRNYYRNYIRDNEKTFRVLTKGRMEAISYNLILLYEEELDIVGNEEAHRHLLEETSMTEIEYREIMRLGKEEAELSL